MVGMTRAHMADPHIVAKIMRGEEARIRPCVGVGYCIDRIYEGGEALCLHNPATGREASLPHVIARSDRPARRVVVVGAGPAGLEAARVAAARGHLVVLFEAAPEPGGQVRLAAALARRREIVGIVDWLQSEIAHFGVDLRCNVFAEATDVLAEAPDVVVIATGGVPNTSFLTEGEALAVTSWDILGGQATPAREVLLFDDNGAHPGASCAEFLARAGARLEFVTPERTVLPEIGGTNYPAYLRAFGEHGVRVTLNRRLRAIRRKGNRLAAVLYDEYARAFEERPGRSGRGRARHAPRRRPLLRAEARLLEPRRDRPRRAARRSPAEQGQQPGRQLPAVPGGRRRRQPQHPCGDLRFPAPVQGVLTFGSGRRLTERPETLGGSET